jgi:hypothetical protein
LKSVSYCSPRQTIIFHPFHLSFPLPSILILHSIFYQLYNRPEVAAVPRDLVPPHQKIFYQVSYTTLLSLNCFIAYVVS